jgi:hypothetical protein
MTEAVVMGRPYQVSGYAGVDLERGKTAERPNNIVLYFQNTEFVQ